MGERRSGGQLWQDNEVQILARIVDAICAVQADLREATPEQWSGTLIDSCRRQKRLAAVYFAPAGSC